MLKAIALNVSARNIDENETETSITSIENITLTTLFFDEITFTKNLTNPPSSIINTIIPRIQEKSVYSYEIINQDEPRRFTSYLSTASIVAIIIGSLLFCCCCIGCCIFSDSSRGRAIASNSLSAFFRLWMKS
jgi:ABC-type multidrug transport system permease subunit